MFNLSRTLETMGKGWFICRLYCELVDSSFLDWNKDDCLTTRENAYNRLKHEGKSIIKQAVTEIYDSDHASVVYNGNPNKLIAHKDIMKMSEEILKII